MAEIRVDVAGETDVGLVRERNEDAFLVLDFITGVQRLDSVGPVTATRFAAGAGGLLLGVFDGMGGASAGDRASALAAEVLAAEVLDSRPMTRLELAEDLGRAVMAADRRIREEGAQRPGCRGMGTTLIAGAVIDDTMVLAHVGDSRAYLLRRGGFVRLTEDQSLFNELVTSGQVQPDDALLYEHSNVILQALGVTDNLAPFFAEIPLRRGDLLLLCSDGLTSIVPEEELFEVLSARREDLRGAVDALMMLARTHGGHDNVTAVLARFGGAGLPSFDEESPAEPPVGATSIEITPLVLPSIPEYRPRSGPFSGTAALVLLAALLMLAVAAVIILVGVA